MEYIPIIIVIAITIFQAVNKNKKLNNRSPRQAQSQKPAADDVTGVFEQLFGIDLEEPQPKEAEVQIDRTVDDESDEDCELRSFKEKQQQQNKARYDKEVQRLKDFKQQLASKTEGSSRVISSPIEVVELGDIDDSMSEKIDMRQAIIYSEILKRPEY